MKVHEVKLPIFCDGWRRFDAPAEDADDMLRGAQLRNTEHAEDADHADVMTDLLHADITDPIIGSFHYLYRELGYGFLEAVYTNGLVVELQVRGLSVRREVPADVVFRGVTIGHYRADLVAEDRVLVEVKATKALTTADERQLLNYLKASRLEVGLLLHFGPSPRIVRRVMSQGHD